MRLLPSYPSTAMGEDISVIILAFLNLEKRQWGEGDNPGIGVQGEVQIPVPSVMVTSS